MYFVLVRHFEPCVKFQNYQLFTQDVMLGRYKLHFSIIFQLTMASTYMLRCVISQPVYTH